MISTDPSKIYLVTGPVQTGKTTRLRAWCDGRSEVDGILAPVVNGQRHLFRISSAEMRNLEELSVGAPAVAVRRYTFNANVFAWARDCLDGAAVERQRWIDFHSYSIARFTHIY